MRYIGIIILLVLCLTLLLFTGCVTNKVKPETASGNLENQEDINQSSNNFQSSSTGSIYEPATEEPATVYPQQWATGTGTVDDPWANDCIETAVTNCPTGGTIFLKAGYYILSDKVTITKAINIIGEGMGRTIIITANDDGFMIGEQAEIVSYVTLKGFTIDGDAQTDGQQYLSPINLAKCDYVLLEDIEAMNGGYNGINSFEVNNSLFQNIDVHDNYRHGVHPGGNAAGRNKYNTYRDIYAWNNGEDGFSDRGNLADPETNFYNVYDNLQCWDNGRFGIDIDLQSGGVLSNSSTKGNDKYGIYLANIKDFNINNCSVILNGTQGIWIENAENVNLTNIIVKNNNASNTAGYGGIRVKNSSEIKFTSCQSYDDRETPLQAYGIQLTETNTGISLSNCKLSPNATGEIYNPAGVVLTVITEKREFLLLSF